MVSKNEKFSGLHKLNKSLSLYINDTCGMNKCNLTIEKSKDKPRPKLLGMLNKFYYDDKRYAKDLKCYGDIHAKMKHDKFTDTNDVSTLSGLIDPNNINFELMSISDGISECYKNKEIVPKKDYLATEHAEFLGETLFHNLQSGSQIDMKIKFLHMSESYCEGYNEGEKIKKISETIVVKNKKRQSEEEKFINVVNNYLQSNISIDIPTVDTFPAVETENEIENKSCGQNTEEYNFQDERNYNIEISSHKGYGSKHIENVDNFSKHSSKSSKWDSQYMDYLYDIDIDDSYDSLKPNSDLIHLRNVLNNIDDSNDWDDVDVMRLDFMENFNTPPEKLDVRYTSTIIEENSNLTSSDISSSISSKI